MTLKSSEINHEREIRAERRELSIYLHDKTLERHAIVAVAVVVIKLEIIVEDKG